MEHGFRNKSFETAIPLQVASTTNNAINIKRTVGLIEDSTDVDYYSFTTNIENSLISFTVSNCVDSTLPCNDTLGMNWDNLNNGNLHVFARVYDEDKNIIKEIRHLDKVVAHISVMLPKAGRYYIEVSSGHGNNYPNYGSVGQYIITGKYSSVANVSTQPTAKVEITNAEGSDVSSIYYLSAEHSNPGFSEITKYTWQYGETKVESDT